MGICDLIQRSAQDFEDSVKICSPIVNKIISGEYVYDYQCEFDQIKEKQAVVQDRCKKEKENLRTVMGSLSVRVRKSKQLFKIDARKKKRIYGQ